MEEEDSKHILLKNMPAKYDNLFCVVSQMSLHTMEDMIAALLAK